VLTATTALYQAKQNLSNARYDYMINQLNIEFARGTLNEDDIARLNASLGKEIQTSPDSIIRNSTAPQIK
jgi:outer membrane protein